MAERVAFPKWLPGSGPNSDETSIALLNALFPPWADAPRGAALHAEVAKTLLPYPGALSLFQGLAEVIGVLGQRALGRPLGLLSEDERQGLVSQLGGHPLHKYWLHAYALLPKILYLLDEQVARQADYRSVVPPKAEEKAPWQAQIMGVEDLTVDEPLEVDVVIIGSGAGGAVAAWELASHGLAVLILEEGHHHTRTAFDGDLIKLLKTLYRGFGATGVVGNSWIYMPLGRSVGGTTTINSGTCMRTPASVLQSWQLEGLGKSLTLDQMVPLFEEVEAVLKVSPAERSYVGALADVVDTGARALGYQHTGVLSRNAEGCDGQGLCCFGCPTDAKRSTNVSFIPEALRRGAFLATGARVERIRFDGAQVCGVEVVRPGEPDRPIQIRTPHVICAAGTLGTPQLLARSLIRSPWLGRNLSIHPAGSVVARFKDVDFRNSHTIPQGYALSDLEGEGLQFEGSTVPFPGYGLMMPYLGEAFVEAIRRYQNIAFFGFMVKDETRGRVSLRWHGDYPLAFYSMGRGDFAKFKRGLDINARLFLAAGAEELYIPGCRVKPVIRTAGDLEEALAGIRSPRDVLVSAFHPLGTARLGASKARGVCDPHHQVFDTQGLYVMDGSTVPSSLGVNPQVTIMSMALGASRRLAKKLKQ